MSLNRIVKDELSGNIAKSYVAQISRFHRIQASTMFHEAAEYVRNELVKMGLKDAAIEQYVSDGAKQYWTYTSPMGWTVNSAELRMVEPEEKLIVSYVDLPQSLHTYSNGTPVEGVTAELIDVGVGTKPRDYEGKNVAGKLVLATGRARQVHELAVFKHGAAGVITDTVTHEMPNVRESLDIPDAHAYQAVWPTVEDLHKVTFGFSISKRQGNHLREMLKKGKTVKLHAEVDAKLFPGKLDVVTATIQGASKPGEEVFLVAHLCHPAPSANDNASGSGLLLEVARTIKSLIDKGKIETPERTIRFIWVPETYGSTAYLHRHEDAAKNLVAGINLDMVGQDQELCRSALNLDRTPDSLPSFLNDLVLGLIERSINEFDPPTPFGSSTTFRYRSGAFSGGSDHAEFTESTIGVPCIMLLQWPDLYYHTSMDTLDKVSADSLKRVGWIAAMGALTLSNAGIEDALLFASQTASRGVERIEEACREALEKLAEKMNDRKFVGKPDELSRELAKTAHHFKDKMAHIVWREQEAVKSVSRLGTDAKLDELLSRLCKEMVSSGEKATRRFDESVDFAAGKLGLTVHTLPEDMGKHKELQTMVPKRLFRGTLSFDFVKKGLGDKEYEWYQDITEKDEEFRKKAAEIVNFMDGNRSLHQILKSVSAEYNEVNPEHALKFVRDLQKLKLVSLK